jgi:hypothetical protein
MDVSSIILPPCRTPQQGATDMTATWNVKQPNAPLKRFATFSKAMAYVRRVAVDCDVWFGE